MGDKAITAPRPYARSGLYAKSQKALALRAQKVCRWYVNSPVMCGFENAAGSALESQTEVAPDEG